MTDTNTNLPIAGSIVPHSRPDIGVDDEAAILRVVRSRCIADGRAAGEFAVELGRRLETASSVVHLTSTGAQALTCGLAASGIESGDHVVIPTYVCHEVRDAVRSIGAIPIYCDVESGWHMTASTVAKVWTARTRAIVAVALYGLPLDVSPLRQFGVPIVGDFCQSFDAAVPAYEPGLDRGDLLVLSFHATKCLGIGRGGAVAVLAPRYANSAERHIRQRACEIAFPDMQAALGLSVLSRYDAIRTRREDIFATYRATLAPTLTNALITARGASPPFRFLVRQCPGEFETIQSRFASLGVAVRRGVDHLLHRDDGLADDNFPGATACYRETVSLPAHSSLSDDELSLCTRTAANIFGDRTA